MCVVYVCVGNQQSLLNVTAVSLYPDFLQKCIYVYTCVLTSPKPERLCKLIFFISSFPSARSSGSTLAVSTSRSSPVASGIAGTAIKRRKSKKGQKRSSSSIVTYLFVCLCVCELDAEECFVRVY